MCLPPAEPAVSRRPGAEQILRWFDLGHLPWHFQVVVEPFRNLAYTLADTFPAGGPQLIIGLQKRIARFWSPWTHSRSDGDRDIR